MSALQLSARHSMDCRQHTIPRIPGDDPTIGHSLTSFSALAFVPLLLTCGLLALPLPSVLAADCLADGDTVSGELRRVETRHPNGQPVIGYHVTLAGPTCVRLTVWRESDTGSVADLPAIRRVQLVPDSSADAEVLHRLLGAQVTARGRFMETHTAWHTGDVLLTGYALAVDP